MSTDIRIYVADLAAYNNRKLHGVWINACDDLEDIQKQINEMLANSPETDAEECAIHDYEGFGGYALDEYEGIEATHEIACFIDEYPDFGGELLNNFGGDLDEARKAAEENYWRFPDRRIGRSHARHSRVFSTQASYAGIPRHGNGLHTVLHRSQHAGSLPYLRSTSAKPNGETS